MINHVPIIRDSIDYYMLTPFLSTLYGRDEYPHRFLRVIEKYGNGGRSFQSQLEHNSNPDSVAVIENVDIETFIEYASYGYTPYVETLLSKFENAIGLSDNNIRDILMTQSLIRDYQSRMKSLIDECKMKSHTLTGRFSSSQATSELLAEANGIAIMWEMLMNTGTIKPQNCIAFNPIGKTALIPIKPLISDYNRLSSQYEKGKFRRMPYKTPQRQREALLNAFKSQVGR